MKNSAIALFSVLLLIAFSSCNQGKAADEKEIEKQTTKVPIDSVKKKVVSTKDTLDYNKRLLAISNNDTTGRWPVKTPYPLPGAILAYNRIIAFYGNLYSKRIQIPDNFRE